MPVNTESVSGASGSVDPSAAPGAREAEDQSDDLNDRSSCPSAAPSSLDSIGDWMPSFPSQPPEPVPGALIENLMALTPGGTSSALTVDVDGLSNADIYQIEHQLAEGGMGVVYRATEKGTGRKVAIKKLDGRSSPPWVKRFQTEARAIAKLNHPNIVTILRYGLDSAGAPFIAMELCEEGTLEVKLKQAPRPSSAVIAGWFVSLAEAIWHAHQQGVVHRDLKPANILFTKGGTIKVVDFGLAKLQDDTVGQTRAGAVLGTPAYMAPEQARGDGSAVGPAADIYALGAVLYECLAGKPPFDGESAIATLKHVVDDDAPMPPGPRDLVKICMKCLSKSPDGRYATAAALAQALRDYLEGKPFEEAGPIERIWKWSALRVRRGAGHLARRWPINHLVAFGRWVRRHWPVLCVALVIVVLLALVAWLGYPYARDKVKTWLAPTPELSWEESGTPFYLYADDPQAFQPAGLMPDGSIAVSHDPECKEKPHRGPRCYRAELDLSHNPWLGVAWILDGRWENHTQRLNLYETTGAAPGDAIVLRFWARSPDRLTVGFAFGCEKDSVGTPAESGWLTLEPEWKEYQINLSGKNLSAVVCGFLWKVERGNRGPEPGGKVRLYLDDIRIVKVTRPG